MLQHLDCSIGSLIDRRVENEQGSRPRKLLAFTRVPIIAHIDGFCLICCQAGNVDFRIRAFGNSIFCFSARIKRVYYISSFLGQNKIDCPIEFVHFHGGFIPIAIATSPSAPTIINPTNAAKNSFLPLRYALSRSRKVCNVSMSRHSANWSITMCALKWFSGSIQKSCFDSRMDAMICGASTVASRFSFQYSHPVLLVEVDLEQKSLGFVIETGGVFDDFFGI